MNKYQGDLTDILRAGSGTIEANDNTLGEAQVGNWPLLQLPDENYPKPSSYDFGDPFSHIKDPLLEDVNATKSAFFDNSTDSAKPGFVFSPKVGPNNIFSRMLQISPNAKFQITSDVINASPNNEITSPSSLKTCLYENSTGLQISSPRITGIRRRKNQVKKVVRIPATSPVNSRAGGEVVPSDLWAWRKYGQKPIKGSPYPRGYYRCSSSKGCSARKQVERSRAEPNMLVITYTSEHNHPWPTQRNALAGSTRAQPSKANLSPKALNQAEKDPVQVTNELKEEPMADNTNFSVSSPLIISSAPTMKKEKEDFDDDNTPMELNDDNTSYRPQLPPEHSDYFFAELGEIGDDDPLDMSFNTTQDFQAGHEAIDNDKTLDAFPSFFDWVGISNTDDPAFEDIKKGLL